MISLLSHIYLLLFSSLMSAAMEEEMRNEQATSKTCFEEGVNTQGREQLRGPTKVESWGACAKKCALEEYCSYWTWAKAGSGVYALNCALMAGFTNKVDDVNTISGPKACQDSSAAYRALVKDLPKIRFGGDSGSKSYRKVLLTGSGDSNTIFPVVSDDDGFANIAAGTYGKGKFLVFPYIEKKLLGCPGMSKSTLSRVDSETMSDVGSMEECSKRCREKTTCNYWSWHHEYSGIYAFKCVLMADYEYTNSDSNVITGDRSCNPAENRWTRGKNGNCWKVCGNKGGPCPSTCGANGFCCRKGYNDCPQGAQDISLNRHSCVNQNQNASSFNEDNLDDWEKLLSNAMEWMTGNEIPNLASYPENLNAEMLPNIKKVTPDKLGENVNIYFITNYWSWPQSNADNIENYIKAGGNLIIGSKDWQYADGSMKSLFLKLGFWDATSSSVEKTVDTNIMPSSDVVFKNAVRSTLKNVPSKRDISSISSKVILNFMTNFLSKWANKKIIIESPLNNNVLKPLFLEIVKKPELDDHFPDFASYFQYSFLPVIIQKEDLTSPILSSKLNTPFPPKVEESAKSEKKVVTINGTYVSKSICSGNCYSKKWISTGLYAKQGQLITVKVPKHVVGKFDIQLGCHTDDLSKKNRENWMKGKQFKRPGRITQWYGKDIIQAQTRLLSPYGGLIYISIYSPIHLGTFSLEFDNVIESPRFIQGLTTNVDWTKMYASSKAPMVELEVPGIIFTIPRSTIDKTIPNMEDLANEWTKIMNAFSEMQGYKMPRPHRFVTDVEISHGWGHAGYPIMVPGWGWDKGLFDLTKTPWALNCGYSWGGFHEIGHEVQDTRWTPGKLGETTNNIYAQYVNEKLYHSSAKGFPSLRYAEDFRKKGRKFENLGASALINLFMIIKHECSWDTFKKFFKYYEEHVPKVLTPNNNENRFSTIAKVLSKECNKNLIPFFQWWKWPVMKDAIEETKHLPKWNGIIEILENAKKKEDKLNYCVADDGKKCVFPFIYEGTEYNECKKGQYKYWCATKVDEKGQYIKDNWAYCSNCNKHHHKECLKTNNLEYFGDEVGNKKTKGEDDCAKWCGETKKCEFWTYRKSDNWCWIKKSDFYPISNNQVVSGTKNCGVKPVNSWTPGKTVNCWPGCGYKGGSCPKICGANGFCCRKGYKDCPQGAQEVAQNYHSCVISG